MSNLLLDRPSTDHRAPRTPAHDLPSTPGSYVDTDGVRRTPQRVGSHVGTAPAAVGSYTDRDGVRGTSARGSYVRTQR